MTKINKNYDAKKTYWKGFWIFVYGGISALITYLMGLHGIVGASTLVILTSILKMVENVIKHKYL